MPRRVEHIDAAAGELKVVHTSLRCCCYLAATVRPGENQATNEDARGGQQLLLPTLFLPILRHRAFIVSQRMLQA